MAGKLGGRVADQEFSLGVLLPEQALVSLNFYFLSYKTKQPLMHHLAIITFPSN